MNKEKKQLRSIAIFVLLLLPFVNLFLGGLWAIKGNYIYAGLFGLASIIWALIASAALLSFTINLNIDDIKTFILDNMNNSAKDNRVNDGKRDYGG